MRRNLCDVFQAKNHYSEPMINTLDNDQDISILNSNRLARSSIIIKEFVFASINSISGRHQQIYLGVILCKFTNIRKFTEYYGVNLHKFTIYVNFQNIMA